MRPEIAKAKDLRDGKIKRPFKVAYHTGQAEGAIPNGTRVYKTNSVPNDATHDGELGTVISSISNPNDPRPEIASAICYFVIWDHTPDVPVAVCNSQGDDRITTLVGEDDI